MFRTRIALAAAFAAALTLVGTALAAATKLTAVVGPSFNITLKKGTKKVTTLKPGKYAITVKDLSNIHNFHLRGPGLNKSTGVSATGTKVWTVTLKKGTYKYVCDPHAAVMKGSFKVG